MTSCRVGGDLLNSTASDDALLGVPNITSVDVSNNVITINGSNLMTVNGLKLQGGGLNVDLSAATQNDSQIQANAVSALALVFGTAYNLIVSNAGASATIPITFTFLPLSVTPGILSQPYVPLAGGAMTGPLTISAVGAAGGNLILQQGTAPTFALGYGKVYVNSTDKDLHYVSGANGDYDIVPRYAYGTAFRTTFFDLNGGSTQVRSASNGSGLGLSGSLGATIVANWNQVPFDSAAPGPNPTSTVMANIWHAAAPFDELVINFPAGTQPQPVPSATSTFLISYSLSFAQTSTAHAEVARLIVRSPGYLNPCSNAVANEIPGSFGEVYLGNTAYPNDTAHLTQQVAVSNLLNGDCISLQVHTDTSGISQEIANFGFNNTTIPGVVNTVTASITMTRIGN